MNHAELDIYVPKFAEHCSSCHGENLAGTQVGPALINVALSGGDSVPELQASITSAHLGLVTPPLSQTLTDVELKGLAIFVGERRMGQRFTEFQFDRKISAPVDTQTSEQHSFVIETVAQGLDPLVFSIEPLPDGRLLLTEKERGLSILTLTKDGTKEPTIGVQSALIEGTPVTGNSVGIKGVQFGSGWLLDVALHPDYATNGWVYLHHSHLLGKDCAGGFTCPSMNRLVRGRIEDGQWIDQEIIWSAPDALYSMMADTGAGGRIAFDNADHVFVSMGIKSTDGLQDTSAQDLTSPYGKVHRVHTDGAIPADNPFVQLAASSNNPISASIWTYGHRSPQGLEWHPERQRVWNSEMGPRGGDEVNELLSGRNYGWPFHSLGLEYLGHRVERHKPKSIEFDSREIEMPLVDITPSPAISSFVVYSGEPFNRWQNDVLIGSLKGSSLYRLRFAGNRLSHRETLISDFGRIRDIEVGYDGLVYLLLESKSGSTVVRLRPSEERATAH